MGLRSRHGSSRAKGIGPVIEVLPADELPMGIAAPQQMPAAKPHRGRITSSARAKEIGRLGGLTKGGTTRLSRECSIQPWDPALEPYRIAAGHFSRMTIKQMGASIGGGEVSSYSAGIIRSAGLQMAFSRHAFDTGKPELGSRLADAARQNLLAAAELIARAAKARPVKYAWDTSTPEPDAAEDEADDPEGDADESELAEAVTGRVGPAIGGARR